MTKKEYDDKKLWEKYTLETQLSLIHKIENKIEDIQELIFAFYDRGANQ
jgi:hypothetical protein